METSLSRRQRFIPPPIQGLSIFNKEENKILSINGIRVHTEGEELRYNYIYAQSTSEEDKNDMQFQHD